MSRAAIILLAGTNDLTRAFHALGFAKQFKESGVEVKLIFDGAGTGWVSEFVKPDHMLHTLYKALKEDGVIEGVCEF